MAAVPLPTALEHRLAALAGRVRLQRVVRGACAVAVAALAAVGFLIALDGLFRLSVPTRCALEIAWLAFVGFLAWRLVAQPWRTEVPLTEIARRLEHQFPGLGERLLTVVELRDHAGPEHGSPQLIGSLARETEQRTRSMNFSEAAPIRPVVWVAAAACVIIVAALAAALVVPGSGERLRRVGLPWHRPAVVVPFRVVVSSGNPVVKRGDAVTLTAYVEKADAKAAVPAGALLVVRDGSDSPERKLPMAGDSAAAFHFTRPGVVADFEYRVEVGPAASEWHSVLVADPVELTDQTTAEIHPPPYAATTPKKVLTAPTELDALQHSSALLRLKFSRPCATAFLDWRPDATGPAEVIAISVAADGLSANVAFPLKQPGTLRVVMINETGPRKQRSEAVLTVRVAPDSPPRFEQVAGVTSTPRTVRPGEHVPLSLTAADDLAVAAAELEFVTGPDDAKSTRLPIPLTGAGTPRAEGRFVFDLGGKGSEGDIVRFRVRVTDNRRLDELKLAPQEAVYPAVGWAELKLSASAPPLEHQELIGQRDAIRAALSEALKLVKGAADDADKVRTDAGRKPLELHHTVALNVARDRARTAGGTLHDAAREAALTPELRLLAAAIREVADRTLKDADDLLRKAAADSPTDRKPALDGGIKRLVEAGEQIEALMERNARVAQDRLDGRKLGTLATDQAALADRTGELSAAELAKRQHELLDRLRQLVAESSPLKRGTEANTTREAVRLAADARTLSAMLRDLNLAGRELTAETRRNLLAGLIRTQTAIADRAAAALARGETAARLAGVVAPKADEFRRVAELLAQNKTLDALAELERLAQHLDRVAEAFDKWAAERADPKFAAKQFVLWQDDLRARLAAATKATPFPQLPPETKTAFAKEQQAIRSAVERLKLPHGEHVPTARESSLTALRIAVDSLSADGKNADAAMKTASSALARLADATPTFADRLAKSRAELERVRLEQEAIATEADRAMRGADPAVPAPLVKRFAPLLDRQQKLLPQFLALDLPGLEERQERTALALKAAATDLAAGAPFDAFASQAWARREIERLKSAIDQLTPVDATAEELAGKLVSAAGGLKALGDSPTTRQLEPFAPPLQEAVKLLGPFNTPEAAALLNDAREAVRVADSAFRDGSKPDELKRRAAVAAEAVRKLSARLNGAESDVDRVKRLAANRRRAFEEAKRLAGRPFDPAASAEAGRQLAREVEELTHTRVGAPGQLPKRKVLELYARTREQREPDRPSVPLKALPDALDELAAAMDEVAELKTGFARPATPPAPDEAANFLPSKPMTGTLRGVSKDERALRDAINGVNAEVIRRTRPAETDPLAATEKKQRDFAAALADLVKTLLAEKDVGAAAEAGKANESARAAADRLHIGLTRGAGESAALTAQRLHQLAATAGDRAWGKSAAALAKQQEAILNEIIPRLADGPAAAARQHARQEEITGKAAELTNMLELAAGNAAPGDAAGKSLGEAAELARDAQQKLADAADAPTAEADKHRAAAGKMLADAAAKAAPDVAAGAEPTAAGDAVRQADAAMRKAAGELNADNRDAAGKAMRDAADALNRAAKATTPSAPPPPEGSPSAGSQSNGNAGAGNLPTTTGDLTPPLPENWASSWGTLPGEVKGKIVQDLQARYGDDYARAIKLYFDQLAEKK